MDRSAKATTSDCGKGINDCNQNWIIQRKKTSLHRHGLSGHGRFVAGMEAAEGHMTIRVVP
jgi:hypothetical protein